MMVVYHDIGGTHSSAVAANLHVNKLPKDVVPDKEVILSLPTFDKIEKNDWGHLIYIGEDELGFKVYTVCRQRNPELVVSSITDTYRILNGSCKGLYLISTSPLVNPLMGIGGFSSRVLHLVSLGRPIVTYGTLKAYKNIVRFVNSVKAFIREDMGIQQ